MRKIYIVLLILVVLAGGWTVWRVQTTNKTDAEIKQTFKEFVEPRYLNGKESFFDDHELASAVDKLTIKSMHNPELFSNLTFEFIKAHTGNYSSDITKKIERLAEIVSYTPSRKGVNKNVFNNLLQYTQIDTQNRKIYLSIIASYLQGPIASCGEGGWRIKPKFMIEWCAKRNNPYNLVYDSLKKYDNETDQILIKAAIQTFFDYQGKPVVANYHFFAISLKRKYGGDTSAIKNDSIVKGISINGEIPEALSKELGI